MNVLEWCKKNWIYCVLVLLVGWGGWSGYRAIELGRRYRTAKAELVDLGNKIQERDTIIGLLKQHNTELSEIGRRWEARDRRLEEIYRGITAGTTRVEGGLSNIQSGLKKLGSDVGTVRAELSGSDEIIRQSLEILSRLQGGGGSVSP